MKSKSTAAAAFAIIFVIIFGVLSQFTPRQEQYVCNGVEVSQWSFFGVVKNGDSCEGGLVSQSVGWPFENKVKTAVDPNASSQALESVSKEAGYQFQLGNFILNLAIYWVIGFVFFFIFSPIKRNQKYISNPYGIEGQGKVYK
jgi:hypothetical protein